LGLRHLTLGLAALLLLIRLPSLVQPMGADQALYAYVGERVRSGGLPYRDAWDQKPPAVHFLYAAMRALWASDAVVPAADLAAAAACAWFLYRLGSSLGPAGAGAAASLLFLLLSNPSFTRLAGIRLRSQCETFMAVAVTAALLLIVRDRKHLSAWSLAGAGVLFGIAFTFKYNAAVFAAAGAIALWLLRRTTVRGLLALSTGFCVPVAAMLLLFALGGALRPLVDATVFYNLQYSAETYAGALNPAAYLLAFPIERARVDALWTLGGAGCLLLLLGSPGSRARLVPVVWVAAACASIAINGSRSLPQYFVQANPALALAAGWGAALAWTWMKAGLGRGARYAAVAAALVVAVAVWRVNPFPKLVEQTVFDTRYAMGGIARDAYLGRYDDDRKYSALAAANLGEYLRAHSTASDRVYIFGFTCAAYLQADRVSASRFFWSRPVIVGFNAGRPGYGADGLLSELDINRPAVIALQQRDWAPDVDDSARFFMATPRLAGWLRARYVQAQGLEGFDVWLRRSGQP
jgi:Dolichyl-phosphate-mannose-protein mannosyltransferase